MIKALTAAILYCQLIAAQAAPPASSDKQWQALGFLEGTWEAKTRRAASGADASGTYTFGKELGGHVLVRYANTAKCAGPTDFNCDHKDLLYVYQERAAQPLKAIYFDSEGHVIHYRVSVPAPGSAVFLSDPDTPGPQFRLVYELKGAVMEGRFQMRLPASTEWTSYLEWSGTRK
jgi:hypothetical protein